MCVRRGLCRPGQRGLTHLGAGIIGSDGCLIWKLGPEPGSSARAVCVLDHGAASPALGSPLLTNPIVWWGSILML